MASGARRPGPAAAEGGAFAPPGGDAPSVPAVCVVLVNWNGWGDTVQCLESLLRSTGVGLQVVVCDNDSGDGSLDHIQAWAAGRLPAAVDPSHPLAGLALPPLPKPLRCTRYDRADAERGGDADADADAPLVLVQTGANLGFAGGCNVGMRFAAARGHRFVWLLNNDTLVRPDTLLHLVQRAERDPRLGMVGSTLLSYDGTTVQALGYGAYNPWLALPRHIRAGGERAGARAAYVVGASMLVRREFLAEVGLLSEDYFLFFEELDWAMRAGAAWSLGHAPESVVFHKEGASNGGSSTGAKSRLADYYFMKNRIVFTRKYFPRRLPTVYLALGVAAARRALRGDWARARMILDLCRST